MTVSVLAPRAKKMNKILSLPPRSSLMHGVAMAPWKRMLQRLSSELDHREERLQDCIFRQGMILALSEVPKSLKY